MERDFTELLKFYKMLLEFGNTLANLGKGLNEEADTAAGMLGDSVSAGYIKKIRDSADKLQTLGNRVIIETEKEVNKINRDSDDFNSL